MEKDDKKPAEEINKRLSKATKIKGNETCADCPTKQPLWVSFLSGETEAQTLAALLCTTCAQYHHFELGKKRVHIKYLKMTHEFDMVDVKIMDRSGNAFVNDIFEANLTKDDFDKLLVLEDEDEEAVRRSRFVKYKYKKLKYQDEHVYHQRMLQLDQASTDDKRAEKATSDHNKPLRRPRSRGSRRSKSIDNTDAAMNPVGDTKNTSFIDAAGVKAILERNQKMRESKSFEEPPNKAPSNTSFIDAAGVKAILERNQKMRESKSFEEPPNKAPSNDSDSPRDVSELSYASSTAKEVKETQACPSAGKPISAPRQKRRSQIISEVAWSRNSVVLPSGSSIKEVIMSKNTTARPQTHSDSTSDIAGPQSGESSKTRDEPQSQPTPQARKIRAHKSSEKPSEAPSQKRRSPIISEVAWSRNSVVLPSGSAIKEAFKESKNAKARSQTSSDYSKDTTKTPGSHPRSPVSPRRLRSNHQSSGSTRSLRSDRSSGSTRSSRSDRSSGSTRSSRSDRNSGSTLSLNSSGSISPFKGLKESRPRIPTKQPSERSLSRKTSARSLSKSRSSRSITRQTSARGLSKSRSSRSLTRQASARSRSGQSSARSLSRKPSARSLSRQRSARSVVDRSLSRENSTKNVNSEQHHRVHKSRSRFNSPSRDNSLPRSKMVENQGKVELASQKTSLNESFAIMCDRSENNKAQKRSLHNSFAAGDSENDRATRSRLFLNAEALNYRGEDDILMDDSTHKTNS